VLSPVDSILSFIPTEPQSASVAMTIMYIHRTKVQSRDHCLSGNPLSTACWRATSASIP
jgi:hypothetical protein